jgi:hypothetical protein
MLFRCSTLSLLAAATMISAPAAMTEDALPGVAPGKSIVQPLPEPLDGDAQSVDGQSVKVGDWDVKVSGFVRYEVGVGKETAAQPPAEAK